ncbi:MAG: Hsp20/alpha crystallin family protein [Terriglobia bacterium]
MAIVRWNPFSDLLSGQHRVNRAFENFWGDSRDLYAEGAWAPAIDVLETDKELVVKAELPGLTSKDVDMSVDEDRLIIKGEKKFEDEVDEEDYYRMERRFGTFERHVPLTATVREDAITATYKKGVFEIHLLKEETKKPTKVKIKVREG